MKENLPDAQKNRRDMKENLTGESGSAKKKAAGNRGLFVYNLLMRTILLFLTIILSGFSAHAQGLPWADFKERTIKESFERTTKAFRPDDSMFLTAGVVATRAEVTFTGKSRPTSKSHCVLIQTWAGMLGHGKDYADLYTVEYLYKEGDNEYWIPTQSQVAKYFDRELKPDDKMVLFLVNAGAIRDDGKVDCVLLVEEYQIPKNMDKVPKPSA